MKQESDKFTAEEFASRMAQTGILIDEGLLADSLSVFLHDNEVKRRDIAMRNAHDNIIKEIEKQVELIAKGEAERVKNKYKDD